MPARTRGPRGFSLIELMIASAIGGIVVAAATTATVAIYRSSSALEQSVVADDDAKTLLDAILVPVQQLAGGSLRPWSAVTSSCVDVGVELPECTDGTDRLHFVQLADEGTQCRINAYAGNAATVAPLGSECCVSEANGYPAGGRLVVLVPNTPAVGAGWQLKKCKPISGGCGCTLEDVEGGISVPPDEDVELHPSSWTGGLIVPGQTVSVYLDKRSHELKTRLDADGDLVPEERLMSDHVYDLQVQFGYDDAPADGKVDEVWTHGLDLDRAGSLRMARVGLVVGAPAPAREQRSSASVPGGTEISIPRGVALRAAEGAVTLRNLLVFY